MAKDATSSTKNATLQARGSSPRKAAMSKDKADDYWPLIAHRDQIPTWLRDNDYILTGHPMPTNSYRKSYRLWRCLHMETMNIWTHFLGSAAFVATGIGLYRYMKTANVPIATFGDKAAFAISLTSAAVCFGLSSTFHTLRSHSYNVHHFWGKMDILGICVLAVGGGISATYYTFYGHPFTQRVYWTVNVASSIAAAFTLFDTGGGGSKMRSLRGGVFALLAISAMMPIFHSIKLLGWDQACRRIGANWYLAEGAMLLLAVTAFVGRIPERFSPGSFDIWGHSHQLFHIGGAVGTAFHVLALIKSFKYIHS